MTENTNKDMTVDGVGSTPTLFGVLHTDGAVTTVWAQNHFEAQDRVRALKLRPGILVYIGRVFPA